MERDIKNFIKKCDKDNELSKAKKTSKWELGKIYESKTIKQVWVGDVTNCITGKKCHLILDAEDNIEDTINNRHWFYEDENLRDKFTSKVTTDKILDVSKSSELLAKRQKEEIIKEIDKMIKYIDKNEHEYPYHGYFAKFFAYYINDFQKELLMDYLYISKYYYEIYNAKDRYYEYNQTYINIKKYLKALNCVDNVNIDEILNKYRSK